jgi:hypothetical protein
MEETKFKNLMIFFHVNNKFMKVNHVKIISCIDQAQVFQSRALGLPQILA